ncbi:MAG: hypothetical protein AAGJ57_04520, partial [Pseudomonadota bacterium]
HEEMFNKIKAQPGYGNMEFNHEQLNVNPAAWTSPDGTIYMGTTAPDYSSGGKLDAAMSGLLSTIGTNSFSSSTGAAFFAPGGGGGAPGPGGGGGAPPPIGGGGGGGIPPAGGGGGAILGGGGGGGAGLELVAAEL